MIDVTGANIHHEIHSQSIIDFTRNNILIRKISLQRDLKTFPVDDGRPGFVVLLL